MKIIRLFFILSLLPFSIQAGTTDHGNELRKRQQSFIDLKFGMFIHFNLPSWLEADWIDPQADPALFNPRKMDCSQWAKAARSAKMRYGCLTTKHHSGFCIWDTQTTDYGVMHTPFRRDVVKEYADAFRKEGLKVMLYYSILDTHHDLRPGYITDAHITMVKQQLTELLTNYGEIEAIIIDGWDAPWSRISYEEVPFEEIYRLIKRLQPDCLVMDLNAAKYPPEALYYTDIKSYEQGAGQHMSKEANRLPALSCLPLNKSWFWKASFPVEPVKDPVVLVKENLEPFNQSYCNFILNVAPNQDGLLDPNTLEALKKIGNVWKDDVPVPALPVYDSPIISTNMAKNRKSNSSWSYDMFLMDFANDDNFRTSWRSHPTVAEPWYEILFEHTRSFNMLTIVDTNRTIRKYRVMYERDGEWIPLLSGDKEEKIKVHRFDRHWGEKIKIFIDDFSAPLEIAELGIYDEQR